MKIVAVVGHHTNVDPDAEAFGEWLAGQSVHLLTGGGGGLMEAVCAGFAKVSRPPRQGWSIGVVPGDANGQLKPGYPNRFVEIVIKTHLHGRHNADGSGKEDPFGIYSRNHINALTADLMVAFPGGDGTYAEVTLARRHKQVLALVRKGQVIGPHDAAALAKTLTAVVPTLDALKKALTPLLRVAPI